MPAVAGPSRAEVWTCRAVFIVTLALHLGCSLLGLHNRPIDGHEFRQTQTALAIRYLAEEGLRLDYATPVLGRPWAVPLEFPLYQGSAVLLARATGLDLEPAARLTALLYFYAMLPALYLLAGRLGLRPHRRLLLLAALLVTPVYLYYQRTVMIESTALCLGIWFLWFLGQAIDRFHAGHALAALAAGAFAAMVKLPTFCAFLLPAVIIVLEPLARPGAGFALRPHLGRGLLATFIVLGSLTGGWAWTVHADRLKTLNPLAQDLLSSAQARWATGDFALRLQGDFWAGIGHLSIGAVLGPTGLALLGWALVAAPARTRLLILLLALCYAAPLVVFGNVYRIHDYYFFANAFFLAAALGLAMDALVDWRRLPRLAAWGLVVLPLAVGFHTYRHGYYRLIPQDEARVPDLGRALAAVTEADEVLLIIGQDWNPVLPYLAGRRALMIPFPREDDPAALAAAYGHIEGDRIGALVATGARRQRDDLLKPVIRRFGLNPAPLLSGEDSDVYIPAERSAAAISTWLQLGLHRYRIASDEKPVIVRQAANPSRFPMMNPPPREYAAQFGLGVYPLDGGEAVGAHPECELVFTVPPGARRLRAGFGLLSVAYADPAPGKHTDGVLFSVLLRPANGPVRLLKERLLDPFAVAGDRGTQEFDLVLPPGTKGEILLRTGAGPAESLSFDWAYWTFVAIE